jgi:hypothetical protein
MDRPRAAGVTRDLLFREGAVVPMILEEAGFVTARPDDPIRTAADYVAWWTC